MITREQANTIASSIVEQERIARMQQSVNKRYKNRHFLYRFSELKQFEAWERPLIIMEADQYVTKNRTFILFIVVDVIIVSIGFWYIFHSHQLNLMLSNPVLLPLTTWVPSHFFKRHCMKKYIRREVNLRKELGYGANSEVNQFVEWNALQS